MEFILPENLREQVALYDPILKPLAGGQRRQRTIARPKAPLGLPDDLVPFDIMSKEEQLEIVQAINDLPAENRSTVRKKDTAYVLIMHHQSIWFAAWTHINKTKDDPYYSFAIAHKAAASTANNVTVLRAVDGTILTGVNVTVRAVDGTILTGVNVTETEEKKYGKTAFIVKRKSIGKKEVFVEQTGRAGYYDFPWTRIIDRYTKASKDKAKKCDQFATFALSNVPRWDDSRDAFSRLRLMEHPAAAINADPNAELSYDTMAKSALNYSFGNRLKIANLIETPFFRKEVNCAAMLIKSRILDPECTELKTAIAPHRMLHHKLRWIDYVYSIWPDAQLDHMQKLYHLVGYVDYPYLALPSAMEWVGKHMPITSFIRIIEKEVDKNLLAWGSDPNLSDRASRFSSTGSPTFDLREWHDTLSMISNILHADDPQHKLEVPPRWRLTEFHDHVSSIAFKIRTINEVLPQDLFPQPIRLESDGKKWSFFQPCDVHQLASWGQAVRNCVGSAASYREGIKKKTHVILLVMLDGQPRFTAQANFSNGIINFEQITDLCNASLKSEMRDQFHAAFFNALQIASQQKEAV